MGSSHALIIVGLSTSSKPGSGTSFSSYVRLGHLGSRVNWVKERLTRIWKFTYPIVAFVGGVAALVSFFFGDLGEVLRRLEPYQTPIIAGVAIVFFICYYIWVCWLIVPVIVREIRGWVQKRKDIRQLRALAKNIAGTKHYLYWFIASSESSRTERVLSDAVAMSRDDLGKRLTKLAIPHPAVYTKSSEYGTFRWAMYLDMLLPLAVKGDIDEARMVLDRIEEQEDSEG